MEPEERSYRSSDPTSLTTAQSRHDIDALEKLLNVRIDALEKAVAAQHASSNTAINKSDSATSEAIKQQGTLLTTTSKGLDDKIDDIRIRVTRMESEKLGGKEEVTTRQSSIMSNANAIGILFGFGGIIIGIVALFLHTNTPAPVTYVPTAAPLTAPVTK